MPRARIGRRARVARAARAASSASRRSVRSGSRLLCRRRSRCWRRQAAPQPPRSRRPRPTETRRSSARCIRTTRSTSRASVRAAAWRSCARAPFDVRDYRLDFRTVPAVVQAGRRRRRCASASSIRAPASRSSKFETVHERQYHLFVISQDMEYFQHIHPEQQPDGTWAIDVTLPKAGYYKVLSDFLPGGGVVAVHRAAARDGRLRRRSRRRQRASRRRTRSSTKTVDDLTATRLARSADLRRRSLRPSQVPSDRHAHRPAGHRSADLSRRVRAHAHHERGHGGATSTPIRSTSSRMPTTTAGRRSS